MSSSRRRFARTRFGVVPLHAALLAAIALASLRASPARAGWFSADSAYASYRIPEHRWSYWTASLDFSGAHSAAPSYLPGVMDRNGSFGGRLGTFMARAYDSDRLQHDWNLSVDASGSRAGRRAEDGPPLTYGSRSSEKNLSQHFSLGTSLRVYPWTVPLGLGAGTAHRLELGQNFRSSDFTNQSPGSRIKSDYGLSRGDRRYVGEFSAQAGLGRVRDATPVHRAQVLEDRLRQKGALTRPLSDQARRALAALYTIESDIGAAHQRPGKYFWRELERILREDGALAPDALEAWDVLRLLEPISIRRDLTRRSGFFIGPAVSVVTLRNHSTREENYSIVYYVADTVFTTSSFESNETVNDRSDFVLTSFSAEIYRPLSPRWQADAFSAVWLSEAGEFTTFSNSISVSYIVSDRWLGLARAIHSASAVGHSRRFQHWDVELAGELMYFLEDGWALRLMAYERQSHDANRLFRAGGFQLGVTWILSGLFEAPGLVGAMRPTPTTP